MVGELYEDHNGEITKHSPKSKKDEKVEMGKFMLSLPKDLRRKIKFESDEKGFKNASDYICNILINRHVK